MKRDNRIMIVSLNAIFILILLFPHTGRTFSLDIQFDRTMVSANIYNVPLEEVCHKISQESGIWFTSLVSLAEIPISVQFADLSMEGALKRILASTNHSLVFDDTEAVIAVIIIGNKTPGMELSQNRRISIVTMDPVEEEGETSDLEKSPQGLFMENSGDMETADSEMGILESFEDAPDLDLPVEVEMDLDNLGAMEPEAFKEEIYLDEVHEKNNRLN